VNSIDATRMILAESTALPDLATVARHVYVESSRGGRVPHSTLRWMVREAGLQGVFDVLGQRHGTDVVKNMILTLEQEIDRQALVG
jgi:hypothetical protein